jgi:sec-independent protein translocase protein TatA
VFTDILQPTHLLIILVVALVVLGPKRLPEAGRSLGKSMRDFKDALSGEHDEPPATPPITMTTAASTTTAAPAPEPAPSDPVQPTSTSTS